jgi:hypothetical protein
MRERIFGLLSNFWSAFWPFSMRRAIQGENRALAAQVVSGGRTRDLAVIYRRTKLRIPAARFLTYLGTSPRGASKHRSMARRMVLAGASIATIAPVVAAMVLIVPRREAVAWSAYSSQTGLRCEQCHTRSGNLTEFGKRFKANGNKLPEPKP